MHSGYGYCIIFVNFCYLFQCCGSRIYIPDSWFLSIPELTFQIQQQQQNFVVLPFLLATNITKLKIILFFNRKKKFDLIYKEL